MRFCTSELKVQVISPYLRKRFAGQDVINVTGIRRQESAGRARAPVAQPNGTVVRTGNTGMTWNAIIEHSTDDVFRFVKSSGLDLHEGYTRYGMGRISCTFCIMANESDLVASSACEDNAWAYREMVSLEVLSTFAFQGSRWLGDIATHLLGPSGAARVANAKLRAEVRRMNENRIPRHLLFERGIPAEIPTLDEARLLAEVRVQVQEAVGIQNMQYLTGRDVRDRYAQLVAP